MTFDETEADYRAKIAKFAKEHPDATEEDLAVLFPKMFSSSNIWAKFRASAKPGREAIKA